ncbi:glycosyltransferase family 4 protein [Chryseobacterium flavum]|uniref:glycosyltransferase family 4 protein n=1 Tax=Chryseobacterium flavum TaxID=415851 RepID=UPI0028AFF6A7|nr:glycosyltransferase family 4 protein [Chryseobacterium flavum]
MQELKTIHIIYSNFADIDKKEIYIGGIQNYIRSLNDIFTKKGHRVEIYQLAKRAGQEIIEGISINSYQSGKGNVLTEIKKMFNFFSDKFNEKDLIIWGTDTIGFKTDFKNVIAIQHGITFDLMYYNLLNPIWHNNFFGTIFKQLQCFKARKNFRKYNNVVCVDYNYLNWIRTQLPRAITDKAKVIPNYADKISNENINTKENDSELKILFARRFSYERGSEIMLDLIPKVLEKYPFVKFTLSGDGPYKDKFEKQFAGNDNVTITKFKVGEGDEFNLNHHITLIPTYGSEGTSFSLLEGMACGAIPVASNVGGMTNIVVDGFNGFLVEPTSNEYFKVIEKIILMEKNQLRILSENARATLEKGFSKEIWETRWLNYIEKF